MLNRLLSITAVLLAAIALAVVGFGGPSKPPEVESAPVDEPDEARAAEGSDVDARLASLESTVSHLLRRIEALEKAQPGPAAAGADGTPATADERRQLEALRSDVDALLTGDALGSEAGRERLKEVVASIQDQVFAERAQRRSEAREQARAERFKRFVQEARLSATQEQDLAKLLEEESRQRRALVEQRRAAEDGGGQPRDSRGESRQLRARTDESARRILNADQVELYEAMRRDERGGGGRGGRDGRGSGDRTGTGTRQ